MRSSVPLPQVSKTSRQRPPSSPPLPSFRYSGPLDQIEKCALDSGRKSRILVLPQMVAESTRRGSVRLDKRHLPPSDTANDDNQAPLWPRQSIKASALPPSIPFHFCAKGFAPLRPSVRPSVSELDRSFLRRPAVPLSRLPPPLAPYSPLTQYNTQSALPPSPLSLVLAFCPSSRPKRERAAAC